MNFERYAIYYTPRQGPLAEFGASWLGWDMAAGQKRAPPDVDGLKTPVSELTATPRKYGFHGTLKPPFYLADGCSLNDLKDAVAALAGQCSSVTTEPLKLTWIGHFLALVPSGGTEDLSMLAGRVVTYLDRFRAPPSDGELARRRQAGLTAKQETLLQRWGYPYVMEEFRFHLTLTGRLSTEVALNAEAALNPTIAPLTSLPFVVDDLTLAGQAEDGFFHEIQRFALSAS